ncbi:MAG TPA: respiratory nitrate reductase subunit gamma [Gaiellaceae bacterium]|nr:respiratory nitrate reductase subunit gamma [Gaiellaceae bacterium]
MSRADLFLWIALPYVCLATFVVGHVWRYARGQLTWTARSTQLLEQRLLRVGSLLFHLGILAVVGGHVLGILVPAGVTGAVGIDEGAYHVISVTAGGLAGAATTLGILVLAYRRLAVGRVRAATPRSDLVMYPILLVAILTGMAATFGPNLLLGEYHYRETVSPWFRGVFAFSPDPDLMDGAPLLFQAHAVSAWLLFAVWPFSRLVHAWSVPLSYLQRSWILYRSRNPRAALAFERARRSGAEGVAAGEPPRVEGGRR